MAVYGEATVKMIENEAFQHCNERAEHFYLTRLSKQMEEKAGEGIIIDLTKDKATFTTKTPTPSVFEFSDHIKKIKDRYEVHVRENDGIDVLEIKEKRIGPIIYGSKLRTTLSLIDKGKDGEEKTVFTYNFKYLSDKKIKNFINAIASKLDINTEAVIDPFVK